MSKVKLSSIIDEILKTSKKSNMKNDIINFFKENPNPNDESLHQWAEQKKYNIHEVETEVYKLATEYVKNLKD